MFWSRRSKRIPLGRTWSKLRDFGRAGRNVSRLVELGRNIDVWVKLVKMYLAGLNLIETRSLWSCRLKLNSLSRTWSKPRCFGRAGQNVPRFVELGQNIEFCCRADRKISRLIEFGRNIDVLVARVKTYLAWSNLVET